MNELPMDMCTWTTSVNKPFEHRSNWSYTILLYMFLSLVVFTVYQKMNNYFNDSTSPQNRIAERSQAYIVLRQHLMDIKKQNEALIKEYLELKNKSSDE